MFPVLSATKRDCADELTPHSQLVLFHVQSIRLPSLQWNTKPASQALYLLTVHYLLTYLLTPWCRVLLEKLTGLQLVKKFPAFHGTSRFITALTSVRHLSLSWASPIQSIYPHRTSWRSILILSTHLRLDLPSGLLPSGFPPPLSSPMRATYPAHLILLDFITRTILGEEYKSLQSIACGMLTGQKINYDPVHGRGRHHHHQVSFVL